MTQLLSEINQKIKKHVKVNNIRKSMVNSPTGKTKLQQLLHAQHQSMRSFVQIQPETETPNLDEITLEKVNNLKTDHIVQMNTTFKQPEGEKPSAGAKADLYAALRLTSKT